MILSECINFNCSWRAPTCHNPVLKEHIPSHIIVQQNKLVSLVCKAVGTLLAF